MFPAPSVGGWTSYTAPLTRALRVSYDGRQVATVTNTGRRCDST
jgi:hypothetical protein